MLNLATVPDVPVAVEVLWEAEEAQLGSARSIVAVVDQFGTWRCSTYVAQGADVVIYCFTEIPLAGQIQRSPHA